MASIQDGFKNIFFAGIGALAFTGEKAKEMVDQLIAKGELTVDQGKQINSELTRKVSTAAAGVQYDVLKARMKAMKPEEREAFAAKASEIAQAINAEEAQQAAEVEETEQVEVEAEVEDAPKEGSADQAAKE